MARKLPWPTTSAKRRSAAKVPKRESSLSTSSDDGGSVKKAKVPTQLKLIFETTPKKNRASCSPSTSPIRGPSTANPMRPGYEADDIYIMVEDELQAVAQTFTHHLHAAEYKRLKKKARDAPPKTIPELKEDVPKDIKRKFEVIALQDRQKGVLAVEGEEKARDPWLGTSLAGLMASSNQPKRALMGSQEIQSSTRAARGFGRGESESPTKTTKTAALEIMVKSQRQKSEKASESPSATMHNGSKARNEVVGEEITAAAQSTKWLDSPASTISSSSKKSPATDAHTTTLMAKTAAPTPSALARAKPASRRPRKKFSFDDDFDMDSIASPAPDQTTAKATAKRKIKVDVKEGRKKTKLNDIPTFLF